MSKGYWVSVHRKVPDPKKSQAYRKLAQLAVESANGKYVVIGGNPQAREFGMAHRVVIVEFSSYETAVQAYESPAYQKALEALGDGAERDLRIVKGVSQF